MEAIMTSVTSIFASSALQYTTDGGEKNAAAAAAAAGAGGKIRISSFYLDSTGRSSISLPLQLQFSSNDDLDSFLQQSKVKLSSSDAAIASDEPVKHQNQEEKADTDTDTNDNDTSRYALGVEAKVTLTSGSGEAVSAVVEDVSVVSSRRDDQAAIIHFDTEILLLVSRKGSSTTVQPASATKSATQLSAVKTTLEVSITLTENVPVQDQSPYECLDVLGMGEFKTAAVSKRGRSKIYTRITPLMVYVTLTNAYSIKTRSVHTANGRTIVSLVLEHSNTHDKGVVISNITLHPAHSRLVDEGTNDSDDEVRDMSNNVRWSFVKDCHVSLPYTLNAYEAYSIAIAIDATMDERLHKFKCPLSVSANVRNLNDQSTHTHTHSKHDKIVSASDIVYVTTQTVNKESESVRINLSLNSDSQCVVGSAFDVNVSIKNLSSTTKNLRLDLSPTDETTLPLQKDEENGSESNENVYESSGSKTLLPIDTSHCIGELESDAERETVIRFIPTLAGSIMIPSLTLTDMTSEQAYHCHHNFRVAVHNTTD